MICRLLPIIFFKINTFFSNIAPLPRPLRELVFLFTVLLVLTLCYNFLTYSPRAQKLRSIDSCLYQVFAKSKSILAATSPNGKLGLHRLKSLRHGMTFDNMLTHTHRDALLPPF